MFFTWKLSTAAFAALSDGFRMGRGYALFSFIYSKSIERFRVSLLRPWFLPDMLASTADAPSPALTGFSRDTLGYRGNWQSIA
jgi:hypothetical protein